MPLRSLKSIWTDPVYKTEVYLSNTEEISSSELAEAYFLMSENRKNACASLRFEADKKRCILADYLVRSVLSEKLGISPSDIIFEYDKNGKPKLKNGEYCFNLSHSGKYVVLAVNKNRAVGVDIEKIKPVKTGVLLRICTQQEIAFIFGKHFIPGSIIDDENMQKRFFEIWTYKEAYLKCSGIGIRGDMKNTVFAPNNCYLEDFDGYVLCVVTENSAN